MTQAQNIVDTTDTSWQYGNAPHMKQLSFIFLLILIALSPTQADDGLPVLRRMVLPDEQLWQLETELTGHRERNGAVLECTAAALRDLLEQSGRQATVEELVDILTTPSEANTPESTIKELILPRADSISVSMDASFAIIVTPVRGGSIIDIYRDTAYGLSVHRLKH